MSTIKDTTGEELASSEKEIVEYFHLQVFNK